MDFHRLGASCDSVAPCYLLAELLDLSLCCLLLHLNDFLTITKTILALTFELTVAIH